MAAGAEGLGAYFGDDRGDKPETGLWADGVYVGVVGRYRAGAVCWGLVP